MWLIGYSKLILLLERLICCSKDCHVPKFQEQNQPCGAHVAKVIKVCSSWYNFKIYSISVWVWYYLGHETNFMCRRSQFWSKIINTMYFEITHFKHFRKFQQKVLSSANENAFFYSFNMTIFCFLPLVIKGVRWFSTSHYQQTFTKIHCTLWPNYPHLKKKLFPCFYMY